MKLLFTFFNPSGGMETLNRIRCKALMDRGIECHLLYTMDGEGQRNANAKGIRTFITNHEGTIQQIVERERYDLIAVCSDIDLLQKIRRAGYEGALIFEMQGLGTLDTAHQLLKLFVEPIRKHANAVLYPQTDHLRKLSQTYLRDIPQFSFDDPLDTQQFGYTAYPAKSFPIVGWIGRLEKNKNWRDFVEIGSNMLKLYPNLYLWMFHDETLFEPSEKAGFEALVRTLALENRLIRYSNILHEQMADFLSIIGDSGGFLCSTSMMEGFGYAVAEAMLCRCPVLSTDSDGVRRFIRHNITGKFYECGNIGQATEGALSLMKDSKLREKIVRSAEEHIKKNFAASLYADRFLDMVSRIAQR